MYFFKQVLAYLKMTRRYEERKNLDIFFTNILMKKALDKILIIGYVKLQRIKKNHISLLIQGI